MDLKAILDLFLKTHNVCIIVRARAHTGTHQAMFFFSFNIFLWPFLKTSFPYVSGLWTLKEEAPVLWETAKCLISCNDIIKIRVFGTFSKEKRNSVLLKEHTIIMVGRSTYTQNSLWLVISGALMLSMLKNAKQSTGLFKENWKKNQE